MSDHINRGLCSDGNSPELTFCLWLSVRSPSDFVISLHSEWAHAMLLHSQQQWQWSEPYGIPSKGTSAHTGHTYMGVIYVVFLKWNGQDMVSPRSGTGIWYTQGPHWFGMAWDWGDSKSMHEAPSRSCRVYFETGWYQLSLESEEQSCILWQCTLPQKKRMIMRRNSFT